MCPRLFHGALQVGAVPLLEFRKQQIAALETLRRRRAAAIEDEEIRRSCCSFLARAQLKFQRKRHRSRDLSPRAFGHGTSIGDADQSRVDRICNDMIHFVLDYPGILWAVPAAAVAGCRPRTALASLERCVKELGFAAVRIRSLAGEVGSLRFLTVWYGAVRDDGGARRPGDGPRLQYCNRRSIRPRFEYLMHTDRIMQVLMSDCSRFPDVEVHHSARRGRGPVPWGGIAAWRRI